MKYKNYCAKHNTMYGGVSCPKCMRMLGRAKMKVATKVKIRRL